MRELLYQLVNFRTKKPVKADSMVFTGSDVLWEVQMNFEMVRQKIQLDYFKRETPCLAKYLSFLPIMKPADFVSLRESATPLLESKYIGPELGIDLLFKIEGKNPTGSFKDRGSAVDISVAKEMGAKAVILASTGNMAASCSCYAAAAGMPCFVLVPEGVALAKLAQVISYGGHIIQIKGTYNDAAALAETLAREMNFYLAGDYAFRVEGQKTAAFELMDQLFFEVPDVVIIPIGCGTNMAAYAKGFYEYQQLGLIDRMPQLYGVQSSGACAVVNSFNEGIKTIKALSKIDTLATAIAVPNPLDGEKALAAIYESQGKAIAVTDTEILEAQYFLAKTEGLFVESASAATIASLLKMVTQDQLAGKRIVCILSGEGLKDPNVVLKSATRPPTIYPDVHEFMSLYDAGYFNHKTMIFANKDEPLFLTGHGVEDICLNLHRFFDTKEEDAQVEKIHDMIVNFQKKGKVITVSDFQDIVQDVQKSRPSKRSDIFKVLDFKVNTQKDQEAHAWVTVQIGSQHIEADAIGVGPVDAITKALRKSSKNEMSYTLTDYCVDIRHQGVDAVVHVELKLVRGNNISLGRASSPDIIQASIEAFEDAYNGFSE